MVKPRCFSTILAHQTAEKEETAKILSYFLLQLLVKKFMKETRRTNEQEEQVQRSYKNLVQLTNIVLKTEEKSMIGTVNVKN